MDYLSYLETVWLYLPYIICTYVFLTLLPKSFCRIKRFADADYEANRYKYHRCYGPDNCCHKLAQNAANSSDQQQQQKQRKTVRRVYPKRQPVEAALHAPNTETVVKRQVQVSAIQTQTNVNQIARMFETGSAATVTVHPSLVNVTTVAAVPQQHQQSPLRKVNRVQPTNVLPEIRMPRQDDDWEHKQRHHSTANGNVSSSQLTQLLLQQEKLDNSNDLLQQLDNYGTDDAYSQEPRRPRRAIPTTLNLHSGSVSSATPSTSSPQSSPPASPQQLTSPVLLRPQFNLKSSLEDIFAAIARNAEKNETNFLYAGCKSLSPVTSIEDILQQRRLSRPLSAYSISDLLNDESAAAAGMDEHYVENFLRTLNKT